MFVSSQVKKGGIKFKPKGPSSSSNASASQPSQSQTQPPLQSQLQPQSDENAHALKRPNHPPPPQPAESAKRVRFEGPTSSDSVGSGVDGDQVITLGGEQTQQQQPQSPAPLKPTSATLQHPQSESHLTHLPAHKSPSLTPRKSILKSPALTPSQLFSSRESENHDGSEFDLGDASVEFAVPLPKVNGPPKVVSAGTKISAPGNRISAPGMRIGAPGSRNSRINLPGNRINAPGVSISKPGSGSTRRDPSPHSDPECSASALTESNSQPRHLSSTQARTQHETPENSGEETDAAGASLKKQRTKPVVLTIQSEEELRKLSLDKLMMLKSDFLKLSKRGLLDAEMRKRGRGGSVGSRSQRSGSVDSNAARDESAPVGAVWNSSSTRVEEPTGSGARAIVPAAASVPPPLVRPGSQANVGPKITIIDGKMVVDEASLVLDVPLTTVEEMDRDDIEVVDETSGNVHITSASFRYGKVRQVRWKSDDSELFYRYLQYFGTDFAMIGLLFPELTRRHVKLKFKAEERANPTRVTRALRNRLIPPKDLLERMKEYQLLRMQQGRSSRTQDELPDPSYRERPSETQQAGDEKARSETANDESNSKPAEAAVQPVESVQASEPTPEKPEQTEPETASESTSLFQNIFQRAAALANVKARSSGPSGLKRGIRPAITVNTKPTIVASTSAAVSPTRRRSRSPNKSPSRSSPERKIPVVRSMSPTRPPSPVKQNAALPVQNKPTVLSGTGGIGGRFKPTLKPKKPNANLQTSIPESEQMPSSLPGLTQSSESSSQQLTQPSLADEQTIPDSAEPVVVKRLVKPPAIGRGKPISSAATILATQQKRKVVDEMGDDGHDDLVQETVGGSGQADYDGSADY
ncbi:Transcription factor TFIIIB component B [Chytriomyces hyalinus]|nr:Transcription factor TFIIIB component B [Chytriomyces hyalinus]